MLDFVEKITDLLQPLNLLNPLSQDAKKTTCPKEHSPFCRNSTNNPVWLNNLRYILARKQCMSDQLLCNTM